jgi:hypothetical protein
MDVYTLNFEDGSTLDVQAGSPEGAREWAAKMRPDDELRSVTGPDGEEVDALSLVDWGMPDSEEWA